MHARAHVTGLRGKRRRGRQAINARGGIGRGVFGIDAAGRDKRKARVDLAQLGNEGCQLLNGNLVELDAIDAFPTRTYARERVRLFCVRFHKQLLFDALRRSRP